MDCKTCNNTGIITEVIANDEITHDGEVTLTITKDYCKCKYGEILKERNFLSFLLDIYN